VDKTKKNFLLHAIFKFCTTKRLFKDPKLFGVLSIFWVAMLGAVSSSARYSIQLGTVKTFIE